jgi:hypothetical protein
MHPLTAIFAALVAMASPAFAFQDPAGSAQKSRSAPPIVPSTVELSYIFPVNSDVLDPVGLAKFEVSLESLVHATLDNSLKGSGPIVKAAFFTGVLFFDRTVAKAGHEYGHVAIFNRAGYTKFFLTTGGHAPEPLTFHEVFINSIIPLGHLAVEIPLDDFLDAESRFTGRDFEEFMAATFAGGLNQEQIHLNMYRERVLRHQFGFFDTAPYLIETLSTPLYAGASGSDIGGYVDRLGDAGFSTSVAAVKAISLVRLFSGSAISAGIGFYHTMVGDSFDEYAPRVVARAGDWTVLWPEFESFMSRRGPTVRATLPLRAGGFLFLPGLETSFSEGHSEFEASLEASRPVAPWLDVSGSLFVGTEQGFWTEAGVALKPAPWVSLLLNYHVADRYTFRRDVYGETFDFEDRAERGLHAGFSFLFKF